MKKKPRHKKQVTPATPAPSTGTKHHLWLQVISVLLVFVAYLPVFSAGFVSWDDNYYVTENALIRSFSSFRELITSPVQGNFHPLTMITLAMNYAFSELHPLSYHVVNLLLHLANVILVYRFVRVLTGSGAIIPFATALLFGIHPLHVESVAWVSERKDVLYTFFFLLGLISYVRFVKKGGRKDYIWSLLWFILSIVSKPAAIIFPVVLFTIDFYFKRKLSAKILLEKIPFILVSAIFAWLTLSGQQTVGATDNATVFSFTDRILFACYGFVAYFLKMFVPVNLVAFYPFPPINETLSTTFYLAPLLVVAVAILCLTTWKKYREITFGFSFYLINLLLVLQFIIVGSALIADRYTYVPLIGLFFIFGWLLSKRFNAKPGTSYAIVLAVAVVLLPVTYNQAGTWKSGETLWENCIKKVPSSKAYVIRGVELNKRGNREKALAYYTEAIVINKADHEAYGNRGNIYFSQNKDSLALLDYNRALELNPNHVLTLANKGTLLARSGNYAEGMKYLNRALSLDPQSKPALKSRATAYMMKEDFEKAITDFEGYLKLDPDETEFYNAIGVCFQHLGKYDLSIKPFSDAIAREPLPNYFLNRSISYRSIGKMEEARRDALEARRKGLTLDPAYEKMLGL